MDLNRDRFISDEFMRRIRETHGRGCEMIERYRVPRENVEPVEIAMAVEGHRWAWRPPTPRLVLVAESHVFTTLSDLAVTYQNPPGAAHAPSNYVRLVYCLAYGEPSLSQGRKGGTPQYWIDIFGKLVGTSPRRTSGGERFAGLGEKVRTLQRMQQAGIWLLDASLHGIYVPKGTRIDAKDRKLTAELQRLWWDGYGHAIITDAKPERIVAVGKGLFDNMRGKIEFSDWIYQPNGARSPEQRSHNSEVLGRLSSRA